MTAKKVKGSNVWPDRWEVQSLTDPDKTYIVARKNDGTIGCSCPAWKFHKAPKINCKHCLALLELLDMVISRTRVFLDADEFPFSTVALRSFPSQKTVDKIMGKSNVSMQVAFKGEQFKVSRVFLEE